MLHPCRIDTERTMGDHRKSLGKTVQRARHEKGQREAGLKCEKCQSLLAF
jgi:hypothetical protein